MSRKGPSTDGTGHYGTVFTLISPDIVSRARFSKMVTHSYTQASEMYTLNLRDWVVRNPTGVKGVVNHPDIEPTAHTTVEWWLALSREK